MMRFVESIWLACFLFGLMLLGVLGTGDLTIRFWYGAALVAVAGTGSLLSRQIRPFRPAGKTCLVLMLIFYAYVVCRGLHSEVKWMARQDLVFATTALISYLLIALRFTSPRQRGMILVVFALLILANTITGLHQFHNDDKFMVFRSLGVDRIIEKSASGFFRNSNFMAGFLILSCFPLLGVALVGRGVSSFLRMLCGLFFLTGAVGLGYSFSRGGIVGFFAALLLFIPLAVARLRKTQERKKPSKKRQFAWFALMAGGFGLLLFFASGLLRTNYGDVKSIGSLNGRGVFWDAALEQWQSSPIIGTGARSYEYMERAYRNLDTLWMVWAGEKDAVYAHNDYLQCLGDYGLIGLALALAVLLSHSVYALIAVFRRRQSRSPSAEGDMPSALAIGGLCSLAGIAVHSLVDFNLHIGVNVVMTGIILGFLAAPGFGLQRAATGPASGTEPVPPAPFSPFLLVMSAVTAGLSVILLQSAKRFSTPDLDYAAGLKELERATTVPEWLAVTGHFQNAVARDPDNPKAWHYLSLVNSRLADEMAPSLAAAFNRMALKQITESLRLYPRNPYAAGLAGYLSDLEGETVEADAFFDTALRYGLNIQSVNQQYADHLAFYKKDYSKAIGFYNIAWHLASEDIRPGILEQRERCAAQLNKRGQTAPPEAFLNPGEVK